jgi:RNA polymerase sigma-70 factor (ECF subfamily)
MSSDPRGRVAPLATVFQTDAVPDAAPDTAGRETARRDTAGPGTTAHDKAARETAARNRYEFDWSVLMAQAQNGDERAYRSLLEAILPYLRSIAARVHRNPSDVEDAVQDIMLTLHTIRHTYDPARPFGPWLVAIANRRLIDRLRRQGRSRARETALDGQDETFSAPEANLYADDMERRALEAAVAGLPPRQREAIALLKLQEMSLKEAAAASGMSVAALKVSVHRGIRTLRKLLPTRSEEQ